MELHGDGICLKAGALKFITIIALFGKYSFHQGLMLIPSCNAPYIPINNLDLCQQSGPEP